MSDLRQKLSQLRGEWRGNPRLRYGVMVVLAILGLQGVLLLSDRVDARKAAYVDDSERLARLQGMRKQHDWPRRSEAAQKKLRAITDAIPEVAGKGMAQAETQAWLSRLAEAQKLVEPSIRVEDTVEVEDYPELWQVVSRLEGKLPAQGQEAFTRALAEALPWVQAERLEVGEGETPRVSVSFRSYYRRAAVAEAPAAGRAPAAAGEAR